ncbi:MAG: 4-hydroxy-3-methylbut-2-enyl diphosphate reductase [Planctomycetota bacterium]
MSTPTTTKATHVLEVIVAQSAGTCFGVEDAIELAEEKSRPILGPLVHNPQVVADLADKGIPILDRYADLEKLKASGVNEVVITAHGYPKELKAELQSRGIQFYDATCPVLLKWVYRKIEKFEQEGYHIVLIGNPDHAEIIASRSYGKNVSVAYDAEAIARLPEWPEPNGPEKVVAICQTTITRDKFQTLVDLLRTTRYPKLKAVDTRCKPVKNQQAAVESLAQWVDAMVILGGFNSSNTTNLERISRKFLPATTYHIDRPESIQVEWLDGIAALGIGAGTSTPKSSIDALLRQIQSIYPGRCQVRRDAESIDVREIELP